MAKFGSGITRFRPRMGRVQFRGSFADSSYAALGAQFRESLEAILGNLDDFIAHMDDVSPDILVEALEPIFEKSQEYVPVDTGDLKSSGYLQARGYRGGARAEIGYGRGGHPDYAIFVHEMPYTHAAPTRAKFLQVAIDEGYSDLLDRIPRLVNQAAGV